MIKKFFKSKTMNFNVLVGGLVAIGKAFGYDAPVEAVTAVTVIGNMFLRTITTKPLSEK